MLFLALAAGSAIARRHDIVRFAIEAAASSGTGYTVALRQQHFDWDRAEFDDLRVSRGGAPVLTAQRVVVRFSLRDLLPGSARRFGLVSVDVERPHAVLERYRDGTFNIAVPPRQIPPPPPQPPPASAVPLHFDVTLHDGSIDLREPDAYDPTARFVRVRGVNGVGVIDTVARTHYSATGAFVVHGPPQPFSLTGTIDAARGYAMHRAKAARFPLRALANYFADSPAVRIVRGRARNFDGRIYALDVRPDAPIDYHASLTLDIDGGAIALSALAAPLQALHGRLQLADNAVFLRGMRGSLAGIPLLLRGGIFDLTGSVTGAPQLRLSVAADGDLHQLRHAFTFTQKEALSGTVRLGVLVEGALRDPMILARARSPRAVYGKLPFDDLDAGIGYRDGVVALLPLRANYGGTNASVRGTLTVGKQLRSELALHVAGPANRLPYFNRLLGDEPLAIDAAATGVDTKFTVDGAAASVRGTSRVAAIVSMHPDGTARVAPFWLRTQRGSLDAGYVLDRPHDASAFWVLSSGLRMHPPAQAAFPGLALPQVPPIDGTISRVAMVGGGSGRHVVLAGSLTGEKARIAGIGFDRVTAGFAGTLAQARITTLQAAGPWGRFGGEGAFSSQVFVASGAYRGTLDALAPYLGSAIPGHGPVAGRVAVAVRGGTVQVIGSDLSMPGATLRGVPISRASLAIAVEPHRLRLYSAHARAAGGDVVAAGTFSLGTPEAGEALSIVADRLSAAALRGIGLPLQSGTLWASGNLAAGSPLPSFRGGVTLHGGRIATVPLSGNGEVSLSGQTARLHRMIGGLGPTYAFVEGSLGSLTAGGPAYDLTATVPAAGIAATLRTMHLPAYRTDGTFNAQVHVGGRGGAPTVSGPVGVPAGNVNGLPFVDASGMLGADADGVAFQSARARVGDTALSFAAVSRRRRTELEVAAPHARLEDFDNFFDTGDTLGGNGSVRAYGSFDSGRLMTSGRIAVLGFRYRNLPIGNTDGVWSSTRNVVNGTFGVGGARGTLRANGSIALSPQTSLRGTVERSRYDLSASVRNLDLSLWIPALGFADVPITGRASGDAAVHGTYPALALRGNAAIVDGTLGPLPLETATVAVHSVGSRIAVDGARLVTPGLTASASGSMGMRKRDPLQLEVHAATDDLPRLVHQFSRIDLPLRGSFESTLQIGGTLGSPQFVAGLDAIGVTAYGVPISEMFGEVRLHGRTLVISNAGATFSKGEATLAGSLPLQLSPLRLGPADQPMNFDVDVVGLDPAIFDAVFGNGTKLGGRIDGHLGLSGTVRAPLIVGRAALRDGSYVSEVQRTPVRAASADFHFNRTSASIERMGASVGAGTVRASGRVEFPHGFGSGSGYSFVAKALAKGAQLDLPAYGKGSLDADLALTKTPASQALMSGTVTLNDAVLPFSAFVKAAQDAPGTAGLPLPPVTFDLAAAAGRSVRVRGSGYGAGLDIGVAGTVRLSGTLASPKLAGSIASTGGTLTYFDRAFRVTRGAVSFDPSDGVLPTIHAVGTASVFNPDPDRARNPYGSAEITIAVDGPIEGLKIDFSTNPPGYSRDQIIAMLAPFGGFINGIAFNGQSPYQVQSPSGITPLGTLSPLPEGAYVSRSSAITVGQEAFNILNAQFTAGLLAPLESALGQGLGLSSVNLTLGYYGNVGFTATRLLGKTVSAVYATTFGLPQIQSFGIKFDPSAYTSVALNFFYQTGPTKLFAQPVSIAGSGNQLLSLPLLGNSGFSFSLQRYL